MELLWIQYGEKYYLILKIGEHDNKIVSLLSNEVSEKDANTIRKNIDSLKNASFGERITFLKALESYNRAFRTYKKSNVRIIEKLNVKQ